MTKKTARYRILLVLKFILVESYLTISVPGATVELALLVPFLLEAANVDRFPANLFFMGTTVGLFFVIRFANLALLDGAGQTAMWSSEIVAKSRAFAPHAGYMFFVSFFGILACVLVNYKNKSAHLENRLQVLNQVLSRLTSSNLSFQNLAMDAGEKSRESERLRITRELHDIIGYTFTSNIMMMEAAISILHKDPRKVARLIDQSRGNTQAGLEKIRASLYHLRNMDVPPVSVFAQILKVIRTFSLATGVRIDVAFNNFPELKPGKSVDFFICFIQQSITNAFLHGQAGHVDISLYRTGNFLCATVKDNGKGSSTSIREGIGISGMRERLIELGGTLRIWSTDSGLEISSQVPEPCGGYTRDE